MDPLSAVDLVTGRKAAVDETMLTQLKRKFPALLDNVQRIDCGNGWYLLVETLCCAIQDRCTRLEKKGMIRQIKEKLGSLRVYVDIQDEAIEAYREIAERLSQLTCEECGSQIEIGRTKTPMKTICRKCAINRGALGQWRLYEAKNMPAADGIPTDV
jgi:hypothetical protein